MQYRLRTLLILLAVGRLMLAGAWRMLPRVIESQKNPSFDDPFAPLKQSQH